jgi:hypothetical protein
MLYTAYAKPLTRAGMKRAVRVFTEHFTAYVR